MFREKDSNSACAELRERLFYQEGTKWFFDTREGVQFGPFDDLDEAKEVRMSFIQCLTQEVSEQHASLLDNEHIEISHR